MASTIPLHEALRRVLSTPLHPTAEERVPLDQALGRHLAAPVATDGPWPATDRSAMDGFALAAGPGLPAGSRLPVVGESLAGHPLARELPRGAAVRIMTGAVVPAGADTVVPVEQTSGFAGDEVELHAAVAAGQNIRRAGSEARAGQQVLAQGQRIRAAEVGTLAVLGHAEVRVHRRPRVAILATGDEIVPVETAPLPHQVRESNSWALAAQVRECGAEPLRLGVAADEAGPLRALLQRGLATADVLLTIGGISKGTHDLVDDLLAELGVTAEFHGIALKPGKPTFFGHRRAAERTAFVFGLPGNPASAFTVFDLLVRPLLLRLCGAAPREWGASARLGGAPFRPNPRLQAVPARYRAEQGVLVADLLPPSPSGDPFTLAAADGYALLPAGLQPGDGAPVTVVGYAAGIQLA